MGKQYRCTKCDLEFCSGWSHHAGGQFLICCDCGSDFVLGGGASSFGAVENESLQLFHFEPRSLIPNLTVVVKSDVTNVADDWDGLCQLKFDDFPCPNCNRSNSIAQSLDGITECPKCRDGHVVPDGSCIY